MVKLRSWALQAACGRVPIIRRCYVQPWNRYRKMRSSRSSTSKGSPPYNQDLEGNLPERVREFKEKIRAADALLIATPEYNYSIPGVLKNAIDWASRPMGNNSFDGKPVAIMSASVGMLAGARAQYHLRQTFVFINMYPVNRPEVMVPFAADKVDDSGRVTDAKTRQKIKELVESLVAWTIRLKG